MEKYSKKIRKILVTFDNLILDDKFRIMLNIEKYPSQILKNILGKFRKIIPKTWTLEEKSCGKIMFSNCGYKNL